MGGLLIYHAYGTSPIHRLDPRVKALWAASGLFFIFSTSDWRLLLALLAVNGILAMVARLPVRTLLPLFIGLCMFGIVILIVQLLFQPGPVWLQLGPVKLHSQGLTVTREVWFRLANLLMFSVLYIMWTHPIDTVLMWVRFGLPYRYAMMMVLALRTFPVLQREVGRIQDAQQVRGKPLHSVWQRISGLVSIMLPFTLRVLRRTTDMAVAMELRGYGYDRERTYLRSIGMKPADWACVAAVLAAVVWRVKGLL